MSVEHEHPEELTDAEHEALRWVDSTPVPAPSPAARERARKAFLTGQPAEQRRPASVRSWVPLALAASLLALFWFGSRPSEAWSVLSGSGLVQVQGEPFVPGDRFASASVLTTGPDPVELQLGERLRLVVPAGARLEIPRGPGRWFGRRRTLRVEEGEVFGTSGGAKIGFELSVESPETRTRVLGTTFAVLCNELGTCVCLYSGSVEVSDRSGTQIVEVPPGERVQFYEDGRPPTVERLTAQQVETLAGLDRDGLVRHAP